MLRLTWKFIVARKERTALLVLGVLIVSAAFGLLLGTFHTIHMTITSDLTQNWRTTYDILVRPADSKTQIEQKYGLVEANYLSNLKGGITMQQYQEILGMPGIEAAAPIAMLGYFELLFNAPLAIDCQPGFYLLENTVTSEIGRAHV
jgi:hypothetical protein